VFASVPLFTEALYLGVGANALCSSLLYIMYQLRHQVTSSWREPLPHLRMKSALRLQKTQIILKQSKTEETVQMRCLRPGPETTEVDRAAVIYVSKVQGTDPSTSVLAGELISPGKACQSHRERTASGATSIFTAG